jgi:hypothetical protein
MPGRNHRGGGWRHAGIQGGLRLTSLQDLPRPQPPGSDHLISQLGGVGFEADPGAK